MGHELFIPLTILEWNVKAQPSFNEVGARFKVIKIVALFPEKKRDFLLPFILLTTWSFSFTSTWTVCGKSFYFEHWMSSFHVFISNSLAWCSHKRRTIHSSDRCFCSGHRSRDILVLRRRTFLIFVRVVALEFKSIVKILIEPPMKDFLPSFSPISSLNSSWIGWNISFKTSPTPSVSSVSARGSANIFFNFSMILFTISF